MENHHIIAVKSDDGRIFTSVSKKFKILEVSFYNTDSITIVVQEIRGGTPQRPERLNCPSDEFNGTFQEFKNMFGGKAIFCIFIDIRNIDLFNNK